MSLTHPSPLTVHREKEGLSLGDVADALQCGRSHLSRIERGEAKASPDLAKRIETLFSKRVTRDQVLFPEEYMPGQRKPVRSVPTKKPVRSAALQEAAQ